MLFNNKMYFLPKARLDGYDVEAAMAKLKLSRSRPSTQKPKTTFFSLPAELRNRIYDLLAMDEPALVTTWDYACMFSNTRLGQVNRQLRCESVPRYWRTVPLSLFGDDARSEDSRLTMRWLDAFGDTRVKFVRVFEFWTIPRFTILLPEGTKGDKVGGDAGGKNVVVRDGVSGAKRAVGEEGLSEALKAELQGLIEKLLQQDDGWVFLTAEALKQIAEGFWSKQGKIWSRCDDDIFDLDLIPILL